MKNDLYHSFVPGFNFWYVLLPVFLLLVVGFALSCLKMSKKRRRILKRDKEDKVLNAIVIAFDVIFHIFFIFESGAGLIQVIINSLGDDSDAGWVLFLLPISLMVSVMMIYGLLFGAGKLTKYLKNQYLLYKIYGNSIFK